MELRLFFFVILWVRAFATMAQSPVSNGLFPELSLSYKVNNDWKVLHKIESQWISYQRLSNETSRSFKHSLTDFQWFIEYGRHPLMAFAIGYQYRLDGEDVDSHRSIQQVSFLQRGAVVRWSHRVRTDQTFSRVESPEYRARYRLKMQLPLSGQRIDPGEFYLSASNESLWGLQSGIFDYENRVVTSLGYYFNDANKLETSIDYRTDRFFNARLRQQFWFKLSWYINI
ncbi:MAG: DUF2490 domain-containing protein [Flavobacteriaceae bacterium]|nr:DUF2490 domain-containing protein [Flavobacteriaceae bacterium]